MAGGSQRTMSLGRRFIAFALVITGLFVACFGVGLGDAGVLAIGLALGVVGPGLLLLTGVRATSREYIYGTAHVHDVSAVPSSGTSGRAELHLSVYADGIDGVAVRVLDTEVPVSKWPDPGAQLPVEIAGRNARRVRVLWHRVLTHAQAAGEAPFPAADQPAEADVAVFPGGAESLPAVPPPSVPPMVVSAGGAPPVVVAEGGTVLAPARAAVPLMTPDPVPVDTMHAGSTATGPAPAESTRAESAPARSAPVQPALAEPAVAGPVATGAAPGVAETPATRVPDDRVPDEPVPDEPVAPGSAPTGPRPDAPGPVGSVPAGSVGADSAPAGAEPSGPEAAGSAPAPAAPRRPPSPRPRTAADDLPPSPAGRATPSAERPSTGRPAHVPGPPVAPVDEAPRLSKAAPAEVPLRPESRPEPDDVDVIAGTVEAGPSHEVLSGQVIDSHRSAHHDRSETERPPVERASARILRSAPLDHRPGSGDSGPGAFRVDAARFLAAPSAALFHHGTADASTITLRVRDLPRVTAFYRDLLGMMEAETEPDATVLTRGDARIRLDRVAEPPPVAAEAVHLTLEVPDVQDCYEQLRDQGVQFLHRPQMVSQGQQLELWAATFRDPAGHAIALIRWVVRR